MYLCITMMYLSLFQHDFLFYSTLLSGIKCEGLEDEYVLFFLKSFCYLKKFHSNCIHKCVLISHILKLTPFFHRFSACEHLFELRRNACAKAFTEGITCATSFSTTAFSPKESYKGMLVKLFLIKANDMSYPMHFLV